MPVIEYARLAEGGEVIHVIKPVEPGANDNQYVIIFEGARDWSLACISGDWEWQSVTNCMSMAADFLADPDEPRTKTFAVGSKARVGVAEKNYFIGAELQMAKILPSSGDSHGRLTIKLDAQSQEPLFRAHTWKEMDDCTFRIYRKDEELERLGRLFQRLEEASYEPVFASTVNNWFMPGPLIDGRDLAWLALPEVQQRAVANIREHCPKDFSKFWLESIAILELPSTALCPTCTGYFPRSIEERWRKICLGCYRGRTPTSYTSEQISAAGNIKPWLVALDDTD